MNPLKVIKIAFTIVGLLLLSIASAIGYHNISFINSSNTIQGEVVALRKVSDGTGYAPTVTYVIENKTYTVYSSVYSTPPAFGIGEKVDVLYQKDNYFDAKIKSFTSLWIPTIIFGSLGLVFFSIGLGVIIYTYNSGRELTHLKREGIKIDAKFKKVEKNKAIEVNGDYPYRLVAQWLNPTDNKVYMFKSKDFWYDPKEYIKEESIKVYIKRGNPKKYYMDVSFLPKLA